MIFNSSLSRPIGIALAFIVACALVIAATTNSYAQLIATLVAIWAVLGISWNILGGFAGLVSFGHAAFFGLGAYTVGILAEHWGISPWIGLAMSALVGAMAGVVIGAITLRLKGTYFTLAMLAYPLALLYLFEWAGFSELVIPMDRDSPWRSLQFADGRVPALICLALLATCLIVAIVVERSRFGLALVAIRQNELAASAAGLPVLRWKMRAVALSGSMAGLAGGLYAAVLLVLTPHSVFGVHVSSQALIVTMFGGLASVWGPVIGSILLIPATEFLYAHFGAAIPGIQGLILGSAIVCVILLMPNGVYWAIADRLPRRAAGRLPVEAPRPAAAAPATPETRAPGSPATGGEPMLEIEGISIAFGGIRALSDVSLGIRAGEIVGVIGPNGAGKTTLFNAVSGFVRPTAGRIRLNGRALCGLKVHEICHAGLGRTFQTVRAFPRLSLLENVVVGSFLREATNADAIAAAQDALRLVGLSGRCEVRASELTNCELRLMELARAVSGRPRLILMDESFAGLSSADIDQMIPVIRKLRDEGTTIVIIEHTMHAMMKLVDRLVVLDRGAIIADGAPAQVIANATVIEAYLGRKWVQHAEA